MYKGDCYPCITGEFEEKIMKRIRFYNCLSITVECILFAAAISCSRKQEHLEIPKRIISLAPSVCSFLLGGFFLVVVDTLARSIAPPSEIPVGIITAMLGGPFFLIVLFRKKSRLLM